MLVSHPVVCSVCLVSDRSLAQVQARAKKLAAFPIHSVMASKQLVRRQSQAALMAANRDEAKVLEQLLLDPRTFEAVLQQINSMAAPKSKL